MRDRLIELIRFASNEIGTVKNMHKSLPEVIADYLIENGVIVPPCKVGDILYDTDGCRYVVNLIMFDGGTLYYKCNFENSNENKTFTEYDIGHKVFFTREEALKAIEDSMHPLSFETDFDKAIKIAKSEAIKEFAERLKDRIGDSHFQNYGLAILEIIVLVKEMTEGDAE